MASEIEEPQEEVVADEDRPRTFDEAACETLRAACASVIQSHPEVRTVSASVDFYGTLNDAQVQKGVWIGESGMVTAPDAILGSTMQTLRLLEEQIGRLFQVAGGMRESLQVLGEELVKKSKELAELEEGSDDDEPAAG